MSTVDPAEIEKFSRMAAEWWDPRGKFKPLHDMNAVRLEYLKHNLPAPARVLDVGCGGGLVSEALAKAGYDVVGIDASEKNIAVARTHAEQSRVAVDYRVATAEALVAEGAQFDAVLALEIIEHVADPAAFVQACVALVKPGGSVVFSTINRTPKAFLMAIVGAEWVLGWLPRGTHVFEKFVKPSELAAWLRTAGATVQEVRGMILNPLTFRWGLAERDVAVNYLLRAVRG